MATVIDVAPARQERRDGVADVAAAGIGLFVVVAIHLDGRAHLLNLPDSFFTPWHALIYGGVAALSGWLVLLGRAEGTRHGLRFRLPTGYGLALAGSVLFLIGGGLDLTWHTVFGIEFGTDALVSPAHLWLFVSAGLMLSGPIRAALAGRAAGLAPTRRELACAVASVASQAGLVGFVLCFLSAYVTDAPARTLPHYPEGTPQHLAVEIPANWGVASYLVTSLVIAAPLAYLVLRWRLPFGVVTMYAAWFALLGNVLNDFHRLYAVASTVLAGVLADAALQLVQRRGVPVRIQAVTVAVLLPVVAWPGQFIGFARAEGLRWPPALVGGVVVLSALACAIAAGFVAGPADAGGTDRTRPPG